MPKEFKLSDYLLRRQQWLLPLLRTGEYEAFVTKMCMMLETAATELPLFPLEGENGGLGSGRAAAHRYAAQRHDDTRHGTRAPRP